MARSPRSWSSDFAALDAAVADGQTLARSIEDRSDAAPRASCGQLPGHGPGRGAAPGRPRRGIAGTSPSPPSTRPAASRPAWIRLAAGSTTANGLTGLLTDHDRIAGQAAASGRAGKYAAALKTLDQARGEADAGEDAPGRAREHGRRHDADPVDRPEREYDTALARLYQATIDAKGRITDELRQAAIDERKAHNLLPSNTSGLVIILAEIGRGGLNQAVIGIEQTKAKLQAAVDELSADATPSDAIDRLAGAHRTADRRRRRRPALSAPPP